MKIDIAAALGAVTREVSPSTHEGVSVQIVRATRTFDTDRDDLWSAITTAERIPRWLLPIEGDLRLGGRYALTGNASGTIQECEAPARLQVTWEYGGVASWVVATLHEDGARTRLVLEHRVPLEDPKVGELGPGAVGVGWDLMLSGLVMHIAGEEKPAMDEAMAWVGSAEGKAFMLGSSDGWNAAALASGASPDVVQEHAARIRKAYGM